jgi:folate-binding protein YgfZ
MISGRDSFWEMNLGAVLRATGDDAFEFLQGQFTNELRHPAGSAVYGLWLNQKGKVLADSQVLRISEKEFLIVSAGSPASVIRQRLEDYIVADDVTLADETTAMHGLMLAGPRAAEELKRLTGDVPAGGQFVRGSGALAFRSQRGPGQVFEVIGATAAIAELKQALGRAGFVAVAPAEIEFARISAGVPAVPADIGPGDLPNEGGLDETAISFTKGCYLGQEVMARLKNLGQVRRRLQVVRGQGEPPAPLTPLFQGEKKVGELRSVAVRGDGFVALAMLSLVNLAPQAGLSLAPGGPATLTLAAHG